ncbi:tetratricopeptide repeat protein [Caryophanon latum]|uniref:Tetratricopeptide repeat protein n=1 Tax=Caryophanon latum TaxID=33977 RepID=A0A1C0YX03_9BACL|nr:tetratricopeptide repeat protein [Caryophanon latum]OCS91664.1 hypothetical protein A6K76_08450 [Caryophanon latum]
MENNRQQTRTNNIVSFIPSGAYYNERGTKALNENKLLQAQRYLHRALQFNPTSVEYLINCASVESELGHYEEARQLYLQAYELSPNDDEIIISLAEMALMLDEYEGAVHYASLYLQKHPHGMYMGDAYAILEMYAIGNDDSLRVRTLPEDLVAAAKMLEQQQFIEARDYLETLVEQNPSVEAFNFLALAYTYLTEYEEARAVLHNLVRTDRANLETYCQIAMIAYYESDRQALEKYVTMLEDVYPLHVETIIKLGTTLAVVGKYEQAYTSFKRLEGNEIGSERAYYYWLTQCAYYTGDFDIAEKSWRNLLVFFPDMEGFEPWKDGVEELDLFDLTQNCERIMTLLLSPLEHERIFGIHLLGLSPFRHRLLSDPHLIQVENSTVLEKLYLGKMLGHTFKGNSSAEQIFVRYGRVADALHASCEEITRDNEPLFQLWFALGSIGLDQGYEFNNVEAIAAAVHYLYETLIGDGATKKTIAAQYGTTTATLTKYLAHLEAFLHEQKS